MNFSILKVRETKQCKMLFKFLQKAKDVYSHDQYSEKLRS